jgi:predicted  nucleic acid-binding Zn-ribbon protein
MPWGQQENQAREAAATLFKLVGTIEKDLARLQEQQKSDDYRYKELRSQLSEIRDKLHALDIKYKDFEDLLERIQYIEIVASRIGGDVTAVTKELDTYKQEIKENADQLRLDLAIAESTKIKEARKQFGIIAASFFMGLSPALPTIYQWIVDLIKRLIG